MLRPLYALGNGLWYSMDIRLAGLQGWSGHGSEEAIIAPPGN